MERYGACKSCRGTGGLNQNECGMCGGTGFSGDAMDYLDPQHALRIARRARVGSDKPKRYDAIELAILSIEQTLSKKNARS